jgi:hypothetical protein
MTKPINLTGKETKQQLIKLIVGSNPYFENKNSSWANEHYFKSNSKPELLKHVKILNANFAAGGDGNISSFRNEEAYCHYVEIDNNSLLFLKETYNITKDNIKNHISFENGTNASKEWKDYINKEHNGFIGHTEEEKSKAIEKLNSIWDNAVKNSK